jgi:hypothetical protein
MIRSHFVLEIKFFLLRFFEVLKHPMEQNNKNQNIFEYKFKLNLNKSHI